MGYTTKFVGRVNLDRELTIAEARELLTLAQDAVPKTTSCPGGYLQWTPTEDLKGIAWDQNEKFYDYIPWMTWLCGWLRDRGISANGSVRWQGETIGDTGEISVESNVVSVSEPTSGATSSAPMTLKKLGELALDRLAGQQ